MEKYCLFLKVFRRAKIFPKTLMSLARQDAEKRIEIYPFMKLHFSRRPPATI